MTDQPVTRLVVVLGYSDRTGRGLHRVCAARLRRAEELARPTDLVVLSGWDRRGSTDSEAELMLRAWRGDGANVICDSIARTTAGNARTAATVAREQRMHEVLVVTSSWHAPRARLIFRRAFRGSGVRVAFASARDERSVAHVLREAVRWPLVPVQLALARASHG